MSLEKIKANLKYELQRAREVIQDPSNSTPGSGRGRRDDGRPAFCPECGWIGQVKDAKHTYWRGSDPDDVEPVDECNTCGNEIVIDKSYRDRIKAYFKKIDNFLSPGYSKKEKVS